MKLLQIIDKLYEDYRGKKSNFKINLSNYFLYLETFI